MQFKTPSGNAQQRRIKRRVMHLQFRNGVRRLMGMAPATSPKGKQ